MGTRTIQTKLLVMLVPLFLVALGGLAGVSYYFSHDSLSKSVGQTAAAVGTDYAKRVHADVDMMLGHLEDLASIQRVRSGDKANMAEALNETFKRLNTFDVIVFVSPDGSSVNNTGATGNYSDRAYFKKVLETRKPAVSDPLLSRATGKLAVVAAVPVVHNGQLNGVLIGTFSTDRLTEAVKGLKFLDTGYGQLADDSGMIIAHPTRPDLVGKLNLAEKKINAELKLAQAELDDSLISLFKAVRDSGKQTQGAYTFVDGVKRIAVATPVDLPGDQRWIMMVAAPEAEMNKETNALAKTLLAVALVCLAAAVAAIVFIAKQFAKPIVALRDECLLLAQGDLREREIDASSQDEIGQLAQGFRDMRANLRALVGKVHAEAEQLAASSEELTASAEQSAQAATQVAIAITEVASGAEAQLSAVEETTSVVEHMSAGIQQVAATTNMVADQSAQAAGKAQVGNQSVERAVGQMGKIEQTVSASAQVVTELGERSKEIGQIVETIAGIAGQTNLLALNAAIEAARAGEQGRGFAVVAEEVRKLAEQSQQATEKIAALIGGIQQDTDKAVAAMNDGTREVKVGADVVAEAGAAFREIVSLVTLVSGQVKEISAAVSSMASGSEQIVGAVQRIDGLSKQASSQSQNVSAATEEQSASMEEIASSSQSLAMLANDLREAVARFQV